MRSAPHLRHPQAHRGLLRRLVAVTATVAMGTVGVQTLPALAGAATQSRTAPIVFPHPATAPRATVRHALGRGASHLVARPRVRTDAPARLPSSAVSGRALIAATARGLSSAKPSYTDPLAGESGSILCIEGSTVTLSVSMPAGTSGSVGIDPTDNPQLGADSTCTLTGVIPGGWSVYAAPYSLTAAPNADGSSGIDVGGTLTLGSWYDGFNNSCYGANLAGVAGDTFVNEGSLTQENYLPSPGCGYPSPGVSVQNFVEGPQGSLDVPAGSNWNFDFSTSGVEGSFTDYGTVVVPSGSKLLVDPNNCPSGIDVVMEEGAAITIGSTGVFSLNCGGIQINGGVISGGDLVSSGNIATVFAASAPSDSTGTIDFQSGGESLSGVIAAGWTVREDDGGTLTAAPGSGNAGTMLVNGTTISSTGTFTNSGTLDFTGGGTLNSPDVVNTGTIESTGPLTQADAMNFDYDNATTPGVLDNFGLLSTSANQSAQVGSQYCKNGVDLINEPGSTVSVNGTFYVQCGELDLKGGTSTGPSTIDAAPVGTVLVDFDTGLQDGSGGTTDTVQLSGTTIDVEGTVPVGWSIEETNSTPNYLAGFVNDGTIDFANYSSGITDTGTFTNNGAIDVLSGDGGNINAPTFVNAGSITETSTAPNSGGISFVYDNATTPGVIDDSGTIDIAGGTVEIGPAGCKTGEDLVTLAGSTLTISSTNADVYVRCGELDLDGGSIAPGGPIQVSPGYQDAVVFDTALGAGSGGTSDTVEFEGAPISVAGSVPAGWTLDETNHTPTYAPGFVNDGTIDFANYNSGITDVGTFTNNGAIDVPNGDGGNIDVPTFVNTGSIEEFGTATNNTSLTFNYDNASLAGTLDNAGAIDVNGGTLQVGPASCKTGEDLVTLSGSTISVSASVGDLVVECGELDLDGGSIAAGGPVQVSPENQATVDYDTGLAAGTGGTGDTVAYDGSPITVEGTIPAGWTLDDVSHSMVIAPGTVNDGTINLSNYGAGLTGAAGTFVNNGTISVTNDVNMFSTNDVTVDNTGSLSVAAGNNVTAADCDLVNTGVVDVGSNANLQVGTGFTQTSAGTLGIGVNGGQYGEVETSTGAVSLDGQLALTTASTPSADSTLTIVDANTTLAGQFSSVTGTAAGGGLDYFASYNPAEAQFVVQYPQVIGFTSTAPSDAVYGASDYAVSASGGASGNPVTLSVDPSSTSVCALSGSTVSYVGVGTCTIDANQSGSADYHVAAQAQQAFAVAQAAQVIGFTSTAPSDAVYDAPEYTVSASGGASGNPVTLSVDPSSTSVCALSGSTVSYVGVGTCTIDANQSGSADYLAAAQVQQGFAVGKAAQSVEFSSTAPSAAVVGGATYAPVVSTTSGLAATVTVNAGSTACTIVGGVVHFTAAAACVLDASQAGNADYLAAAHVQQTVTVGKGTDVITITSKPPSAPGIGATYRPTATASSGAVVAVTLDASSTGCTLSAGIVKFTGFGTCVLDFNVAATANYKAATQLQQRLVIGKGAVVMTVSATPASATSSRSIKLTSKLSSTAATGTVTFKEAGVLLCSAKVKSGKATCTVDKALKRGTYTVTATYGGSKDYLTAVATTRIIVT